MNRVDERQSRMDRQIENVKKHTFDPPGELAEGSDWVHVMDAAARFPPPAVQRDAKKWTGTCF